MPLESLGTSLCLALRVLRMQIGYPADLSRESSGTRRGIRDYSHPTDKFITLSTEHGFSLLLRIT